MPTDRLTDAVQSGASLAQLAQPRCGTTVVIAVDGRSGTGKTTYAARLGAALGAPVLHLDDVYPGWDGLEAGVAGMTRSVLVPLAAGEPAAYDRWDWMRDRPGRQVAVPPTPMLVVEGVGAGSHPAGVHAAVTIWLEADDDVRKHRALTRDGEVFARQWDRWAAQEERVMRADQVRDRADLVVDTTAWTTADPS